MISRFLKSAVKAPVYAYRLILSPWLGRNCRFYPTCSAYMIEAVDKHGAGKGAALGIKRICKCHPYHKGEYHDPVPQDIVWSDIIGYKRTRDKKMPGCGCDPKNS